MPFKGPFIYVKTRCRYPMHLFSEQVPGTYACRLSRSLNCSQSYLSVQPCNRHDSRAAQYNFNALHCATWKQSSRIWFFFLPWVRWKRVRRSCDPKPFFSLPRPLELCSRYHCSRIRLYFAGVLSWWLVRSSWCWFCSSFITAVQTAIYRWVFRTCVALWTVPRRNCVCPANYFNCVPTYYFTCLSIP